MTKTTEFRSPLQPSRKGRRAVCQTDSLRRNTQKCLLEITEQSSTEFPMWYCLPCAAHLSYHLFCGETQPGCKTSEPRLMQIERPWQSAQDSTSSLYNQLVCLQQPASIRLHPSLRM